MTGDYVQYFENFISTVGNFMSNVEDKSIMIISDALDEYDNKYVNGIHVRVKHISNFPYPTINRHKYQILADAIEGHGFDYIAYFDADTVFRKRSNEFWDNMINMLKNGKVICPVHLWFNSDEELINYNGQIDKRFLLGTQSKFFFGDSLICNFDFINKHKNWIITSMFIMSVEELNDTAQKLYFLNKKCDREWLRILKFSDETLYNLILYFDYLNGEADKYVIEKYISYDIDYYPDENTNYFVIQKYDNENIKKRTKYNLSKKTIYIHPTHPIDNYTKNLYYQLLAKNCFDSNILFAFNESVNPDVFKSYTEILPYCTFHHFYDINFNEENLFFKKSFYINYFMLGDYENMIILNGLNEENVNIDYSKLCDDPNVQFKANASFDECQQFRNVNWMYFSKEFIENNWIHDC